MRNTTERRQLLLEYLIRHRHSTVAQLCLEFAVSERTIRRDLLILSCSHPIHTFQGGGGGVRVAQGYYLGMKYLTDEQAEVLERLPKPLNEEEMKVIGEILQTFKKPKMD